MNLHALGAPPQVDSAQAFLQCVPKRVYGTVERSGSTNQSRWCLFFVVILARIGPKELNGLTLHQALEHSLRLRRGEVKILEGVSGIEMGLNIEDTTFCKSASLVDPCVQESNTVHGDGPCEVYGRMAGDESAEESL